MMASYQLANVEPAVGGTPFYGGELPVNVPSGKGIFTILWRRMYLLILFAAAALGTTELYLRRTIPEYSSTASISVEEPVARFMGNSFAAPVSPQFLDTQAVVISSVRVLELAEKKLKAAHPAAENAGTLMTFQGESNFVPHLQRSLTALVDPKINSIEVTFVSPYPDEAAEIANTIVAAFLESHQTEAFHDSEEVLNAAQGEKVKRDAELADGLTKLKEVRTQHSDLVETEALTSRINALSTELAKAQVAEAQAQGTYGQNSSACRVAAGNERRLSDMLAVTREELAKADASREELQQAQQDVNHLRDQADEADKLLKDTAAASAANHSGVARLVVFDDARPELTPIRPRKMQLRGLAAILGLILGGLTVVMLDQMDHRITGPGDIVAALRLPILGTVPKITGQKDQWSRGRQVQLAPVSIASEAYRAIWKSICFGTSHESGVTLLVTSPSAGNGKSTTASNLAIAMGRSGERVLLIDADFYRPGQHTRFGVGNSSGLSSVLSGQCSLKEAIQKSTCAGLDVLTSGPMPEHPAEILRRGTLEALFHEIREHYDWAVVDSPPVNTVSDTLTLAALCHTTILVVRAGKSTMSGAAAARDSLMSVGANLLGVVINGSKRGRSGYQPYGGMSQPAAVRVSPTRYLPRNPMGDGRLANGHSGTNGNGQPSTDVSAARNGELKAESTAKFQADKPSDLAVQPHRGLVD